MIASLENKKTWVHLISLARWINSNANFTHDNKENELKKTAHMKQSFLTHRMLNQIFNTRISRLISNFSSLCAVRMADLTSAGFSPRAKMKPR